MAGDNEAKLEAARRWFKEAQYGLMVHWGLYALLGGEWRGRVMPGIAEWAQAYFRIPNAEYAALAKAFDPILFDADEWVRIARDAGMKYIVFTSKHHDGFAMFRSKVSPFNVVDATPFGRDVVGELAEACRKHGLRLGLYYSRRPGRTNGTSPTRRRRTSPGISRRSRSRRSRRSSRSTATSR